MARIDDIKSLFDKICNTHLTIEDEIPEISSEDKVKLVELIDNAKAEVNRLHILDIMKKICE